MPNQFGEKLKRLREEQKILQRQVAPLLEIDTPLYSKIERGERTAKKDAVIKLAQILRADSEELLTLWLADQLSKVVGNEDVGLKAIQAAEKEIKLNSKKSKGK